MHALTSARLLELLPPLVGAAVLIVTATLHFGTAADAPLMGDAGPVASPATARAAPPPVDLAEIAGWPLFGEPRAETAADAAAEDDAESAAPSLENLPPATLPLQLKGIAFSADGTRAYAIIGGADGQQHEYRAGDELQSGVTLHSLKTREVVISNQGKLESLALPALGGADGSMGEMVSPERPRLPRIQARMPAAPPPPPISIDGPPAGPAGQ